VSPDSAAYSTAACPANALNAAGAATNSAESTAAPSMSNPAAATRCRSKRDHRGRFQLSRRKSRAPRKSATQLSQRGESSAPDSQGWTRNSRPSGVRRYCHNHSNARPIRSTIPSGNGPYAASTRAACAWIGGWVNDEQSVRGPRSEFGKA
jgi:hypothetical protein